MSKRIAKYIESLLYMGQARIDDPLLKMRLLAFNGTILAVVTVCTIVLGVYVGFGYFQRLPSLLPWLILFPGVWALSYRGHFLLARIAFMCLAWSGIACGVYLFGSEGMVGWYCLPATFFPFVLFTGREWRWLLVFGLGSVSLFAFVQYGYHVPAATPLPEHLAGVTALVHTVAAFLMAVLPFTLLFFQSEMFYREILRKTEERVHAERIADLGRIAAGTAHEVNNPLTIVHFVLQLLEQDEVLRSRPEFVQRIHKGFEAIERIKNIVQRLLSLTQSPLDAYEYISLAEIAEIVQHLYAENMRDSGIFFELELLEVANEALYGQKGPILEILINLISNAIDAVRGQAEPRISLSFRRDGDYFNMLVTDNGPGVPADKVDRIFAPFFTTKEFGKGTGLGLSSSRSMARHHGGDLVCFPGPVGQFVLRLPLHSPHSSSLDQAS